MGKSLIRNWRSGPLIPTVPRTGDQGDSDSSWRKKNLWTRGKDGRHYEENFTGLGDRAQNFDTVPITGTIGLTEGSLNVLGTGTTFTQELRLGQQFYAIPSDNSFSFVLVVRAIQDDTHLTVWGWPAPILPPWPTVSGLRGERPYICFPVNEQVGSALWGNVLKLDQGSFVGVGDGTFTLDGQPIPGVTLDLTRHLKIALYDATLNSYSVFPLGMGQPPPPSLAAVGGGVKMQGGNYSLVTARGRYATRGYNNPSERADVTISTNDKIAITFPAMDTSVGQDAWPIWVTTFIQSQGSDLQYLNGPWRFLKWITSADVSPAGGTVEIEYYDAEVQFSPTVTFDNDPPVDAEFIDFLNKSLVLVSCQGQGNITNPTNTSPGPFIVPGKLSNDNIEAFPLDLAFSSSPPETIVGAVSAGGAVGRLYLMTVNKLQIAQATPSPDIPILIRPFWHDGFANPYQLVFVNGILYGYPVAGPSRSASDGDEQEAERNWAAFMTEIMQKWNPGQVLVGYDPFNDAVVFFHAGDRLNAAGFWTTKWEAYSISQQFWSGSGEFSADDRDQVVSGVATVGDRLVLKLGGRKVA